jgi:hypothetical protein
MTAGRNAALQSTHAINDTLKLAGVSPAPIKGDAMEAFHHTTKLLS